MITIEFHENNTPKPEKPGNRRKSSEQGSKADYSAPLAHGQPGESSAASNLLARLRTWINRSFFGSAES